MSGRTDTLVAMLEHGQDSAPLRFSLGNEFLNEDDYILAAKHLRQTVQFDPDYSAAWKLLGKALTGQNCISQAIAAYRQGIKTAEAHGDRQSAKEMAVFLRRLEKESNK